MSAEALNLEHALAVGAAQRAADQLRAIQDLIDKAMEAPSIDAADCARLAQVALALHERFESREKRLRMALATSQPSPAVLAATQAARLVADQAAQHVARQAAKRT